MKNKTIKILFASAALALMLCACGQGDTATAPETDAADAASAQTSAGEDTGAADAGSQDAAGDVTDADQTENIPTDISTDENADAGDAADEDADASAADATSSDGDTATEDSPGAQRDLFADFIMGKINATTSDKYISELTMNSADFQPGNEYSIDYIKRIIAANDMIGDTEPKLSYAPLDCKGANLFAFTLYYETQTEATDVNFICADTGEEVKIVFGIDGWSRRSIFINENGIISDSGASGAGSHIYKTFAPDSEGIYHLVSDVEENYYGWDFYDENGDPVEALNTTMQEAAEGNDKAQDVVYYREIINGKVYYYFLGTGKLTQSTVDYIDKIAASHDFKFDGKATADDARTAYEQTLGVEEACKNDKEAPWKSLN